MSGRHTPDRGPTDPVLFWAYIAVVFVLTVVLILVSGSAGPPP